jgi:transposase-like protein
MARILSDILSLTQYLSLLKKKKSDCICNATPCPHCGILNPWRHGYYKRKSDRLSSARSFNPIPVQRYFCPACNKTFSVLPECIPPHRWHVWEAQQVALLLLLAGKSVYATAKEIAPSRHTITRWLARFKEQFLLHKDAICNHITALGRTVDFAGFWESCLKKMPLSKAMRLCHVAGVLVP